MLDWLPENVSTFGGDIDHLFYLIYYITVVALVLVMGVLMVFVIVYRRRPGRTALYSHGNPALDLVWTGVTSVILVALAVMSRSTWAVIKERPPPAPQDMTAMVIGKQFNWVVRHAGPDRRLGTEDDLELENELYVRVDTDVWLTLASEDVIHSFFVPQFRLKQDTVPGRDIPVWFQAVKPGVYEIACAELCGFGHGTMRGQVHVLTDQAYEAWEREHWPSVPDEEKK